MADRTIGRMILMIAAAAYVGCMRDTITDAGQGKYFTRDTEGLPKAMPMVTREVKHGETLRLEAAPAYAEINGIKTRLLVYGGHFPGPVLKVGQGSRIYVNLVNGTGSPTTLHPHGLRLDYRFDGVPNYTQKPIAPGDSFLYQLDFPDPGLYWYHPHVRTDYQADMGLYGAFLVMPKDSAYWGSPVDREEVLILDDVLLDSGGIAPYPKAGADHALMGRYGNTFLINGKTDYALPVKRRERVRFFILNAAGIRVFNLGGDIPFWRVLGSDLGRAHRTEITSSLIISPAERYVAETHFARAGEPRFYHKTPVKYLTTGPYYAPGGEDFAPPPDAYPILGRIQVADDSANSGYGDTFYKAADTYLDSTSFPVLDTLAMDSILRQKPDFTLELSVAMDHGKLPMSLMPKPVDEAEAATPFPADSLRAAFKAAQKPGGDSRSAPYFIPYQAKDTAGNALESGAPGELTPLGIRQAPAATWLERQKGGRFALAKAAHNDPLGLGIEWYDDMPEMNAASNTGNVRWIMRDFDSGLENMRVRWQLRLGKLYHIRIWNKSNSMHPMAHFIHFHGQRAMLIAANGVSASNPVWKDTFLVGMGFQIDLLLEASNPGGWMAHCHIAEHAEASMMTLFRVD